MMVCRTLFDNMPCLQGLLCLTSLVRLAFDGNGPSWRPSNLRLSLIAKLTTLQSLRLPGINDYPSLSHLSALRCRHVSGQPTSP